MQHIESNSTMAIDKIEGEPRQNATMWRVLLIADLVESVRLMQSFEADVIDRWRRFVAEVRVEVLPLHNGRLVKSLGDGMLLDFESPDRAAMVAFELQRRIGSYNADKPAEALLALRVGLHAAPVVVDELDVFGAGVNVAARIASLAGPGQIVVSAEVSDMLVPGFDARLVDLGECFLKHIDEPVRCLRLEPPNKTFDASLPVRATMLQPVIAVLPFRGSDPGDARQATLGAALADDVIGGLSLRRDWRVISRLSTAFLGREDVDVSVVRRHLGAGFVVCGRCHLMGRRARVTLEVVDARDGAVLLATDSQIDVAHFFSGNEPAMERLVREVAQAIDESEARRARRLPLPSLESYTLYLGGNKLLHRLGRHDFARSRELLMQLHEREPRTAAPSAMLAKWHVLRLTQGWATDRAAEVQQARGFARRALQVEPSHAFALTVDGLVALQTGADRATARQRYEAALESDPQEAYAWSAYAGLLAYEDRGAEAVSAAKRAIELSPLDPQRFMFETYLAVAHVVAEQYEAAIAAARASIRMNRCLTASFRILAVAQALRGDLQAARTAVGELMAIEPDQSIARFVARYPGRESRHIAAHVDALRAAGMPE